ncbi:cation:proton antiporter [Candidatus Woesearchaeota archaeon]|nr:cation:proton antiporter [Candidatus Woesearchaeota archaeon]
MDPMLSLLIIIIIAYSFGEVARYFKIPRVVGQLFGGIVLGVPYVKDNLLAGRNADLISFLADLGILLLFFFVGLQIDMYSFKKYFRESSLISLFNTALPLIGGFILFRFLGFNVISSVIVGICLAVSSQSVSVAVLEELKMLKSKIAKLVITAGAVDDVFELILISVVLTLIHASIGQASSARVILDISLFVAAIVAFRYLIIPVLMHLFAQEKSITYLFTGAVVITLILALVTFYLGLGAIIGALFAGIIVREVLLTGKNKKPWEEHNIAKAIHIASFGFLVPIFFAWVGINTDLTSILSSWDLILVLVAIAVIGTVLGSMIGVKLHKGGTWKEGFTVGWGVTPKGDVELVIATLALTKFLISETLFSSLIMMAILTTLISPIVFRHLMKKWHPK